MRIVDIERVSETSEDAVVVVSDGSHRVFAFSHLNPNILGTAPDADLHIFDATSITVEETCEPKITRRGCGLGHEICGRIEDRNNGIVCVDGLRFMIEDDLPADAKDGDCIRVICDRVDLW